jgi:uncharacterized DUF497 family protein
LKGLVPIDFTLFVCTIIHMNITFDPAKDATNITKHGVSLADAVGFEWDEAITWPDLRHEYGENRMAGIGYIGNRLFYVVFVDRDENRRIISLRKANQREVNRYAQT